MTQWRWPWSAKRAANAQRPLTVEELENRNLLSIAVGALGDSITAPYQGGAKGIGGDRSWAELLQTFRGPEGVTVYNVAHDGATSTDLLAQGQDTKIGALAAAGRVNSALLFIGINDATVNLGNILAGDVQPFIQTVKNNVATVLETLTHAGPVHAVVANIPDSAVTPLMQGFLGFNPTSYQRLTDAIALANQQIDAVAAAYQVPVIDLFDLSLLTRAPLTLGGTQVTRFLAPDRWHPGTVEEGLIANAFLAALNTAYGTDISGLSLSDQDILTAAGISHAPGATYWDVSRLVLWNQGQVPVASQPDESAPVPVTVAAAPPQFQWAGFGQALAAGTAKVLKATAAPVADPNASVPASASPIVAGSLAGGARAIAIAAAPLSGQVRQTTEMPTNLLDAVFAEADAAFFLNAEGI